MGTGSGILSIIGLKLGARHAMATDIDPNAIRATEENFEINGVAEQAEVHRVNILDETEARQFYGTTTENDTTSLWQISSPTSSSLFPVS